MPKVRITIEHVEIVKRTTSVTALFSRASNHDAIEQRLREELKRQVNADDWKEEIVLTEMEHINFG